MLTLPDHIRALRYIHRRSKCDAARILCGLRMILQTWLRRRFKESPEQIAEIYARASSILNNGV